MPGASLKAAPILALGLLSGCTSLDPLGWYTDLSARAGGAEALVFRENGTDLNANQLIAQSYRKCTTYRRSLSVTQRGSSATLAFFAAAAGALGLAFTPAGPATLAAFTAAGTIFASWSGVLASTTYAGLSAQTIERRLRLAYDDKMDELTRQASSNPNSVTVAQITAIHSRCSLSYILGDVEQHLATGENPPSVTATQPKTEVRPITSRP